MASCASSNVPVGHCYHIRKQTFRLPTVTINFSLLGLLDNNFSTAAPSLIQPQEIHLQVEDSSSSVTSEGMSLIAAQPELRHYHLQKQESDHQEA